MILNGAYGPYVKGCGRRNNLKIPKEMDAKKITKKQAEEMLLKKFGTKALPGKEALKKASKNSRKSTRKTTSRKA